MAFASSNLKLTQVQAVVRVSGTGGDSGTIDLDVDLKKATETASTPTVNITRVHWACATGATLSISRNSVKIMQVTGNGWTDWYGWVENTENQADIDISIVGGDAQCWIELNKVGGFGPQQHQDALGSLG